MANQEITESPKGIAERHLKAVSARLETLENEVEKLENALNKAKEARFIQIGAVAALSQFLKAIPAEIVSETPNPDGQTF